MIESTVSEDKVSPEYPRLMIEKGRCGIVLFTDRGTGRVVSSVDGWHHVGHVSDGWATGAFQDFHGTVTLRNKS